MVLWNGEQPPLSCPGLCIQIDVYDFKLCVRASLMCVSLRAGQQVWGTDGGSGPAVLMQELASPAKGLRLSGEKCLC